MSKKEMSYTDAYNELCDIVNKIEGNEVDIDELSKMVERANYLVDYCEQKLIKIEHDVKKSFQQTANDNE